MRPSDAVRRRTVTALGNDDALGRMGEDTFERRLDRAFVARSRFELLGLRADRGRPGAREAQTVTTWTFTWHASTS